MQKLFWQPEKQRLIVKSIGATLNKIKIPKKIKYIICCTYFYANKVDKLTLLKKQLLS